MRKHARCVSVVLSDRSPHWPLHHRPLVRPDTLITNILPETVARANVTWWRGRSMWITSHTVPLFNIWYYSARLMALYRARRLNATGSLGLQLPPFDADDVLYIPSPREYHFESTWERDFTQVPR